jgi:ribosomal protein L24E
MKTYYLPYKRGGFAGEAGYRTEDNSAIFLCTKEVKKFLGCRKRPRKVKLEVSYRSFLGGTRAMSGSCGRYVYIRDVPINISSTTHCQIFGDYNSHKFYFKLTKMR